MMIGADDVMTSVTMNQSINPSINPSNPHQRYDNVFVYFQPGNGKVKIKEPIEMANKALGQLQQAIDSGSSN